MDVRTRVLLDGNLANEVGLIVLDTIELFCGHFKVSSRGVNFFLKIYSPLLEQNVKFDVTVSSAKYFLL